MKYCNIGGQAVIEGVMMKSKTSMATAVRTSQGNIEIQTVKFQQSKLMEKLLKIPVIRGAVNLISTMIQGVKILLASAEIAGDESLQEEYKPSRFERWLSEKLKINTNDAIAIVSVTLAVILFVGLFILLPSFLASFLPDDISSYLRSLLEGLIRIAIFLGYLAAVSAMNDIRRTFMYHGAEHKVIAAFEHDAPLTPESAAKYSRLHPRCGTSFLLIVMVVAVLVYGIFPFTVWWQRVLVRVLMLPVVAGLSYEVLKLLSKSENPIVKALRAPGLALQYLTTKEPTHDMLEVSIAAFKKVLVMDGILPEESSELDDSAKELQTQLLQMDEELQSVEKEGLDLSQLDEMTQQLESIATIGEDIP